MVTKIHQYKEMQILQVDTWQ